MRNAPRAEPSVSRLLAPFTIHLAAPSECLPAASKPAKVYAYPVRHAYPVTCRRAVGRIEYVTGYRAERRAVTVLPDIALDHFAVRS
ncbi:hypothetical protein KCP77_08265 [Salmonella enterica subsp. enterica]|nr:hypothetical protein KCP77_08265 [Salmonella enterica subsp. enterica]